MNDSVTAGNCARWGMDNGAFMVRIVANEPSGTGWPVLERT